LRQFIITKQLFKRFNVLKYKSFKKSFIISLKQGLVSFFTLILLLGLFEYSQGVILGKPTVIINMIDFAISVFGFLLMFAGKFLESFYGKQ